MKDNKIDVMQSKCGEMIAMINRQHDNTTNPDGVQVTYAELIKGIRQFQYDLELLRKCTLDDPDFKWSDNQSQKPDYYQMKRKAFRNED